MTRPARISNRLSFFKQTIRLTRSAHFFVDSHEARQLRRPDHADERRCAHDILDVRAAGNAAGRTAVDIEGRAEGGGSALRRLRRPDAYRVQTFIDELTSKGESRENTGRRSSSEPQLETAVHPPTADGTIDTPRIVRDEDEKPRARIQHP